MNKIRCFAVTSALLVFSFLPALAQEQTQATPFPSQIAPYPGGDSAYRPQGEPVQYPFNATQGYPQPLPGETLKPRPDGTYPQTWPSGSFQPQPGFQPQPNGSFQPQPGTWQPQSGQPQPYYPDGGFQQPGQYNGPRPVDGAPQPFGGQQTGPGGPQGFDPPQGQGEGPMQFGEQDVKRMQQATKMMDKDLKRMEKRLKALEKQGIPVPAELNAAFADANAFITRIRAAQTGEELQEIDMGEFGDFMQTINEEWQQMEQASRFPRMLKEANKILKQHRSQLAKAEKRTVKLQTDVKDVLDAWRARIGLLQSVLDDAKRLFETAQTEEALGRLEDDFFGDGIEELFEKQRVFDMLSNLQRGMKDGAKRLATFEKRVSQQKKSGKDVTHLLTLIAEAKQKTNELKALAAGNDIAWEDVMALTEELQELEDQFRDAYANISGQELPGGPPTIETYGPKDFKPIQMPGEFNGFRGSPGGQFPPAGEEGSLQPGSVLYILRQAFFGLKLW